MSGHIGWIFGNFHQALSPIIRGPSLRACSAPPQVSDSQLTLFVHAVFLPGIAV